MKHKLPFFVVLLATLAFARGADAQSFSYTYQGKTLNYTITYGNAELTGFTWSFDNTLDGTVAIPDSVEYQSVKYPVKSIAAHAFEYGYDMDTLVIPNTVLSIGDNAFQCCKDLVEVTFGNSLSSIGALAFEQDTLLVSLNLPASVTSIGANAFRGCKGLTSISVAASNTVYDSRNGCNAIIQTNTNMLVLGCVNTVIPSTVTSIGENAFSYQKSLQATTIPNSVVSLGNSAFAHCDSLASIVIPNSVTQIGNYCFTDCPLLSSVTFGDSIATIGGDAFSFCTSLTGIVIPNTVTSLGSNAFDGCSSLASATLPDALIEINYQLFRNCTSLTSIAIPRTVNAISTGAFEGCTSLASVTFSDSASISYGYINSSAFKGCSSLTTITIPKGFNYIYSEAFQYCTSLTSVTLGGSLYSIGDQAFGYCSALTEIHCKRTTPPTLGVNVFLGVSTTIPVYVPCTISDYQASLGWNAFTNYMGEPYVVTVESAGNGTVDAVQPTCEHDTATLTATPAEGFIFYRWSDGNNENPRVFHPTSDLTLTATFGPDTCVVTTLPYTMNFEDGNLYTNCWTRIDQDGDGHGWERVASLNNPHNGLYYLRSESYINDVGSLNPDNWFISPAIQLPEGTMPQLRWYAKGQDTSYFAEHYSVYLSTTGNSPADFTTVLYTGTTTKSWEEQVAVLSAYAGQTVYLAFRHHNSSNMFQLNLDDITIIDLYSYIPDSCFVDTFPYTMGFEDNDNLACWKVYDNNNDGLTWNLSTGVPHTGTYSGTSRSYNEGAAVTPDNWLVSCPIQLPADTAMMLGWFAKGGDPTDFAEHYSVYVSNTGNLPNAFSTVLYTGNTTNNWEQHFVDLSAYAGQLVWVAFRHHDCSDMNFLNIDDITILEATAMYTINAYSGNAAMGTVSGGGVYHEGTNVMLTATPNSGYHFTHWQDNNTDNPRTVTVTANASYIAYFAEDVVVECDTVTTFPWNNTFEDSLPCWRTVDADGDGYNWGYIEGSAYSESYSYFDGTNQALSPDNWLISRPIRLPANGDATLVWAALALNSMFYSEHYSVYVSTTGNNPSDFTTQLFSETMTGSEVVVRNASLQNYRGQTVRIAFRHHNSSDVFALALGSIGIGVVWDPVQYTLTAASADTTMGTVSGGGTYNEGDTATLTATAAEGYHFVRWNDNNTSNPREVVVTANVSYTAYFEANPPVQYTLTVTSDNTAMGTVSGGGTYNEGDTATLAATAAEGYHFVRWNDNDTNNPREVVVAGNVTYTAYFEANPPVQYTLTVTSDNTTMGTVSGGGTYNEGDTVTLIATAAEGYHFVRWNDNNTSNPREVVVAGDVTYTAYFEANPQVQYTLTVTSDNTTMGTVSGGGTYNEGDTVTLTATAKEGYRFVRWNDNNTDNPREVVVTSNATYTAYFEATQGIDDVNLCGVNIYSKDGYIIVDTELDEEVNIYDVVGHKVDGGHKGRFDVPVSGVYLVKVGTLPMKKVVVVR